MSELKYGTMLFVSFEPVADSTEAMLKSQIPPNIDVIQTHYTSGFTEHSSVYYGRLNIVYKEKAVMV